MGYFLSIIPGPQRIGFATTLTPTLIQQAIHEDIDLLITHHDTWEFMLDERQEAHDLLNQHQISHIWCHEPLDKSDFGTAAALLDIIGCEVIAKIVDDCGSIGEFSRPQEFSQITDMLNSLLGERPARNYDSGRPVARSASLPGAGMLIDYLVEAIEYDIDLFITGETSLYLFEYARYRDVSVLVYSHNYTEIFGTKNLTKRIADQLAISEIVQLDEPHF